ncbi:MAG: hypothetical protein Tsb0017_24710 [Geothermobacteraceae bacterium]
MTRLTVSSHGRINLPAGTVRQLRNQTLEVASCSRGHLLLTAEGEGRVCLAGTLGDISLPELLSFFNMFRKTGVLRLRLPGGEKSLFLRDGEIVHAASSFAEEELGEILYRLGKVGREDLDRARQLATSRNPIGKVLVEKQLVTPKDLWQATHYQAEQIVFHLLRHDSGSFSWEAGMPEGEVPATLSMNTQNLIMEGLRQADERGLFMEVIGSLEAFPVACAEEAEGLGQAEEKLFGQIRTSEPVPARELLRHAGLGDFDGMKALYQLIEKKLVRMQAPTDTEVPGRTGELIRIYNGALKAMYARILPYSPRLADEVRLFLRDLPQPYSYVFQDIHPGWDGTLDAGRIAANLAGLDEDDRDRLLAEAFNELLYMKTMVARRDLPSEDSAELVARVQEIARRVRELVGRNG